MLGFILLCRRGLSTASWWLVAVTTWLSPSNPLIEHSGAGAICLVARWSPQVSRAINSMI